MTILFIESLSKNYKINIFLAYLLSIINIENLFIISKLIFELVTPSFALLITTFISFFTIF